MQNLCGFVGLVGDRARLEGDFCKDRDGESPGELIGLRTLLNSPK
jgi:hypothetical protein